MPEGPFPPHAYFVRIADEAEIIPLPPAPLEGHLAWVEKADPGQPRILEGKEALNEIKKALASKRQLWLVVK